MSEVMIPISAVAYLLVSWSVVIAILNLSLWYYLLKKRLPKTEKKYIDLIEEKEKKYMDKLDNIVAGKDDKFNAIFDEQLPKITEKIEAELPAITDAIITDLGDPQNEKIKKVVMNFAGGAIGTIASDPACMLMLYNSLINNPDIKRSIQGHVNGHINGAVQQIENRFKISEQDMKDLHEMIQWLKAYKDKVAPGKDGDVNPMMQILGNLMGGGQTGSMGLPM